MLNEVKERYSAEGQNFFLVLSTVKIENPSFASPLPPPTRDKNYVRGGKMYCLPPMILSEGIAPLATPVVAPLI